MGIGAVKYADLANDRIKDYVFDWNRMLAFDGNTAPYLMYAHARIRSILRKAGEAPARRRRRRRSSLEAPQERALALALLQLPGTLARAAETLQPHRICGSSTSWPAPSRRSTRRCPVLRPTGRRAPRAWRSAS